MIVVWSKRSIGPEGRFVRDEANRAQRRGTYLPVCIDNVEPPLGFGELHAISLRAGKGRATDGRYRRLLQAVRASNGGQDAAHERAPTKRAAVETRSDRSPAAPQRSRRRVPRAAWALLKPGDAKAANSIAVLPFANLSGDAAPGLFLGRHRRGASQRVVAAARSEGGRAHFFRSRAQPGRVQRRAAGCTSATSSPEASGAAPGMVRISSQLHRWRSGLEQWSASYDRPEGNVLAIQTDIAENVVSALSVELGRTAFRP